MIETRNKEISNKFSVTFTAKPINEISIHSNDIKLGSMSFSGRIKALEVYQNITSTKDARNFISIVNDGTSQDVNGARKTRLMRIMGVET